MRHNEQWKRAAAAALTSCRAMRLYLIGRGVSTCRVQAKMYASDEINTKVIQDACSPRLLLGCLHRSDRRCAAGHRAGCLAVGRLGHSLWQCWGLACSRLGSHCWRLAAGRGTHWRCLAWGRVEHNGAGQEHAPKVCSCCKATAGREQLAVGATEWASAPAAVAGQKHVWVCAALQWPTHWQHTPTWSRMQLRL